jgi:polyisoprenyl-phosphate glycosyltransferase
MGLMVAFFGVGQLFCLAIMGAYLGRVFNQVKGRPLYFVDRIVTSSIKEDASRGASSRGG